MNIISSRKGHFEGTSPLHVNEPESGPIETSRPSLGKRQLDTGSQPNRVFLIVPCATRQNPCRGSLCWPVGANSGSNQKENRHYVNQHPN